jgi:hypothetical protein
MTERTIRAMAKELAGTFYEQKRSGRFRSKDSLTRVKTIERQPDGLLAEVIKVMPFQEAFPTAKKFAEAHWPFFVEPAKRCLTAMLAMPDARVSPYMKNCIYDAFIEENEKARMQDGGKRLLQRELDV